MRTTFAAREFTDDPLPDDTLLSILDRARFAPSGGNRQGWHVVVRDRATREALAAATMHGFGGTITTLAVSEEPKLKTLLGIPDHVAVCAVMPLGRPLKPLTKLRRKPVDELATRERWDGAPLTVKPRS